MSRKGKTATNGLPNGLPNKTTIIYLVETKRGTANDSADGSGPRELPNGIGLKSRESTNRHIRDYAQLFRPGCVHLVKNGPPLEESALRVAEHSKDKAIREAAAKSRGIEKARTTQKDGKKKSKSEDRDVKLDSSASARFRDEMVNAYVDLGWFGGVLNTGVIKLNNVMPAITTYDAVTRFPITKYEHVGSRTMASSLKEPRTRTLWDREKVLYALYAGMIVTNPKFIVENRLSDEDMRFFYEALVKCWEHTNSGFRGENNLRGLWVVKHSSPMGSCPDYMIEQALDISCDDPKKASCFEDYEVRFEREALETRGLSVVDLEELYDNWDAAL